MKVNVKIAKTGQSFELDFDALPDVSKEFLVEYGLRQKLSDTVSDSEKFPKDSDAAREQVQETYDALLKGIVRRKRGGARLDPIETIMREYTIDSLREQHGYNATDAKAAAPGVIEKTRKEKPDSYAKLRAKAEAEAKRRAKAAKTEDDLELAI